MEELPEFMRPKLVKKVKPPKVQGTNYTNLEESSAPKFKTPLPFSGEANGDIPEEQLTDTVKFMFASSVVTKPSGLLAPPLTARSHPVTPRHIRLQLSPKPAKVPGKTVIMTGGRRYSTFAPANLNFSFTQAPPLSDSSMLPVNRRQSVLAPTPSIAEEVSAPPNLVPTDPARGLPAIRNGAVITAAYIVNKMRVKKPKHFKDLASKIRFERLLQNMLKEEKEKASKQPSDLSSVGSLSPTEKPMLTREPSQVTVLFQNDPATPVMDLQAPTCDLQQPAIDLQAASSDPLPPTSHPQPPAETNDMAQGGTDSSNITDLIEDDGLDLLIKDDLESLR